VGSRAPWSHVAWACLLGLDSFWPHTGCITVLDSVDNGAGKAVRLAQAYPEPLEAEVVDRNGSYKALKIIDVDGGGKKIEKFLKNHLRVLGAIRK